MIKSPTLLLDEEICRANIQRMAEKAERHGLTLKPHFKTHQSAAIGDWFRDVGVRSITVSSVRMAEYFAEYGWNDITIGFPVNIREIDKIKALSEQIESLSLFAYNDDALDALEKNLRSPVQIYIEIDTGAQRSGLAPDQLKEISRIKDRIENSANMQFKGFYSHPGHSYSARSKEEILNIHRDLLDKMQRLKKEFPDATVCVGDTPCCSSADHFEGVDEISPGNFVFYDLMQVQIGSCSFADIAVALAAPVAAKYPNRSDLILHGGAVHLSKESISWNGNKVFGLAVALEETAGKGSWSAPIRDSYLKALSQEHGVLKCSSQLFNDLKIGDLVGILPVHSCLTTNLMGSYYSLDHNGLIS